MAGVGTADFARAGQLVSERSHDVRVEHGGRVDARVRSMVAMAAAIAWGRIYVGVHWPFDMAGGVLVGTAGALAAHLYGQRVTALLERLGDSVHAAVMGRRHAP